MALVLQDRVREISTTTGDGTVTLSGAYPGGYRTFASCVPNSSTTYYCIHNTTNGVTDEWEVGLGTYSSNTLTRDTVLSSSNGGAKTVFSAGDKEVFITYPSEKSVYEDASNNVVQSQFTSMNVTGTATINVATLTSGTITTSANSATDIVNKAYVDNAVAAGVHFHAPVRVESPTALSPVTYNNGTSGVGATLTNAGTQTALVVDGVSVSVNDRVLIYTQTDATQNGVYVVTNVGSGSTNWVLTRSDDTDTYINDSPDGLSEGSTFFVQQGDTGAGETYTCNTQGTITFGTTNITFVQVSSAQIYSAGTGLNLSGTTFSVATTGVSAATYGTASQVPQIAINAQGQVTSASNVAISITSSNVSGLAASATTDTTNASNISSGTLANARTTASSSNGASTIVARDASGNFSANTITANVTGNISGSAATLTTARNFQISGGATAANVSFDGSAAVNLSVTAMNASVINSGTIPNANTTASASNGASTIVARDASGNFTANNVTATNIIADGSTLTALNASVLSSGTIPDARFPATLPAVSGANLTSLNATALASGTVPDARFPATLPASSGANLTSLNASALASGTAPVARLAATGTPSSSTFLRGDSAWVALSAPNNGTLTMNVSGTGLSGSATFTADQSGNSTFTVASNAASANGASTIVARDASGNFSANTVTAALTGNASTATSAATWTTARTLTLGSTGKSVNGSANVTWTLAEITGTTAAPQFGSLGIGTAASGTTGEIRATNNITAYYSDERLKTKIGSIDNALEKVKQIETMVYHANETAVALGYDASVIEVGVTAQSVERVMPQVVAPAPIDDKYLTVRYERLVPLLIEAIKELEAQVAELKAK
jgi:hypothetical protein